MTIHYLCLSYY